MTRTQETIRDLILKAIPNNEIEIRPGDSIYPGLCGSLGSEPLLLGIHKVPGGEILVHFLAEDGYHDFISEDEYNQISPELWEDIKNFLVDKVRGVVQEGKRRIDHALSCLRELNLMEPSEDVEIIEDLEKKYKDISISTSDPDERRAAMDVSESLNITKSYLLSRASL